MIKFSHYFKKPSNRFLKFYLLIFFAFSFFMSTAQLNISGKVTAADSILQGATIQLKGTNTTAITDEQGRYTISAPSNGVLVFSYAGYKNVEERIKNQSLISVELSPSFGLMSDVVVIGYGTQKRKDLTGSISSVSSDQINERPVSSFQDALQGLAPGLNVMPRSARPGNLSSVTIRGIGSITGGFEPLYVVDGFPTDAANASAISPLDIQSIDILKDASSTAIYGSRGANGVIIITTKSGRYGSPPKVSVDINAGVSTTNKNNFYDVLNASEYVQWYKEKAINNGTAIPDFVTNWDGKTNTNWQDLIYRTAPFQNYAVSISGGGDKLSYLISANYIDQQDILLKAGYKKYSARVKVDYKASKRITLGLNIAPNFTVQDQSAPENDFAALTGAAVFLPPIIPARNADGTPSDPNSFGVLTTVPLANPLTIAEKYKDRTQNIYLSSNGYVEVEILKGLTAKTMFGANLVNNRRRIFQPGMNGLGLATLSSLSLSSAQTVDWLSENTLNFKRILGKHSIDLVGGYSAQKVTLEAVGANASTFPTDLAPTISFGNVRNGSSDFAGNTLVSYLGRLNYSYDNKYLFTSTIRRDGSSRFGSNKRWGVFPSVAIGWNIGNESFFSKALPFINVAKLRASYGTAGSNSIGDFSSRASLTNSPYAFGGAEVLGFINRDPGNPDLSWEISKQVNTGIDLGLFNKINVTFDYFNNRTKSLLLSVNVPTSTGYSGNLSNIGTMQKRGFEISISANIIKTANFAWNVTANALHVNQKVINLGPNTDRLLQFFGALVTEVGGDLEEARGLNELGILTQKDIDAGVPHRAGDIAGDFKYQDVNNDGIIDAFNGADGVLLGSNSPKWTYGFNTSFSYKNFQISALLQGQQGARLFDFVYQLYSIHIYNINMGRFFYDGRYVSEAQPGNGRVPRAGYNDIGSVSSWEMQSTDFLRIRNINLSYTFPKRLADKLLVHGLKTYFSAENLFTFTKFDGGNPQASRFDSRGSQGAQTGVDGNPVRLSGDGRTITLNSVPTAPLPRIFTLGFNFSF